MNDENIDPEKILSSGEILERLEAVCKRHFSNENDQNECYVFVLDSLKADNYKRLRAYQGRSKLNTYLYSLTNSLVIDFRRKRYGRRRIPASVAQLGKWAEAVYRLVCWQKFSFDDAYDFLRIDGLFEGPYDKFIKEIEPIRNAPCRENPTFQSLNDPGNRFIQNTNGTNFNPLESLVQKLDRKRRFNALEVIRETIKALSPEDQLLVRLVYGSEQPVSVAARVMGLSASAARRRLKGLLAKFREELLAKGIREP